MDILVSVSTCDYIRPYCAIIDAEVHIDSFSGRCKEYHYTPIDVTDVKLERLNRQTFFTHAWTVKRTVDHFDKITIVVMRCASPDGADYCESFRNVSLRNFETFITNSASPWSRLFGYDPPLRFPLKPGKYLSKRQRIDDSVKIFALSGYWKVKVVGFEPNGNPMICIQAEGSTN
ncbi:unnamed protein product [Callosobruchus maculatus]|uniref:Uncharacterized protein n=1 Tax=Callosobruchus maculatus TaxID=64391 RepID=A0A653DNS1_CALMS|nr:unnamed protein product [Callosobruchus maculatus]